jgi:hypothetical protein
MTFEPDDRHITVSVNGPSRDRGMGGADGDLRIRHERRKPLPKALLGHLFESHAEKRGIAMCGSEFLGLWREDQIGRSLKA